MNITDYVKQKNARFDEEAFNDVDALVLCQLFYSKIEHVPADARGEGRLRDFYKAEYFDKMFSDGITDGHNRELFAAACASPRYRDLTVKYIETETDAASEKQFAAAAFVLDGDTDMIVFRGTDGSMLGWKEDFNMAFMDVVPSQKDAVSYIDRHFGPGSGDETKALLVGGHSKGGNLAIYGAVMSDPSVHRRVRTVYSFEGPGFREDVFAEITETAQRDGIEIIKVVPQTSLIGMLLESSPDLRVVEAKAIGVAQHAAFTWQVENDDLKYTTMSYGGDYNGRVIRRWLSSVGDAERELLVDKMFELLAENDIDDVGDLRRITPSKILEILDTFGSLDDESRKAILNILLSLIANAIRYLPPDDMRDIMDRINPFKQSNYEENQPEQPEKTE